MTRGVEHLFMCLLAIRVSSFEKCRAQVFCSHYLIFIFLLLICGSYLIDSGSCQIRVHEYFLLFCGLPTHFLSRVFQKADILNLDEVLRIRVFLFFQWSVLFISCLGNVCLLCGPEDIFLCFLLERAVSVFMCRFMIHVT